VQGPVEDVGGNANNGLPVSAKAGIATACVVFAVLLATVGTLLWKRKLQASGTLVEALCSAQQRAPAKKDAEAWGTTSKTVEVSDMVNTVRSIINFAPGAWCVSECPCIAHGCV
jgi:hypothetical protein